MMRVVTRAFLERVGIRLIVAAAVTALMFFVIHFLVWTGPVWGSLLWGAAIFLVLMVL